MTDLERRIREAIAEFSGGRCVEALGKVLLDVLDVHKSGDGGHKCVQVITVYSVETWYDDGNDCPTVVAIGRGLGVPMEAAADDTG